MQHQQRTPQACGCGQYQCKRFVQQAQAPQQAKACKCAPARQPGAMPYRQPQRQSQPKGLGSARQVGPPITKAAEKGQVHTGADQGQVLQAADLPGCRDQHPSQGHAIQHRRQAQSPQIPMPAPVTGHDCLPEQQRRLGVSHVVQVRHQGQPLAAACGQAGDAAVDHLVAIAGQVQAVQPRQVANTKNQKQ